jgi:Ca-activated chloride channel family protein
MFALRSRHSAAARLLGIVVVVAWGTAAPRAATAQGVLVDARPAGGFVLPRPWPHPHPQPVPPPVPPAASYRVAAIAVDARLADQVARVQYTQTFENTGGGQIEATFVFPLPYDSAVDQLTLLVDGKEHPAQILDAATARRRYEDIVRSSRDPALLEWVGGGMIQSSVFPLPPGAKRQIVLRYSHSLRQAQGLTDWLLPLRTARYSSAPLDELRVQATLESPTLLKNIYSPTHPLQIERLDGRRATVKFAAQQVTPDADFRLFFDSGEQPATARIVSYWPSGDEAGYFMLLATPSLEDHAAPPAAPKTVICVVDRSGSMSGPKMEQARKALDFVLNRLNPGDLFNVVAYDSEIEAFRPELQKYDEATRAAALGFANGLFAGGSTNIDGALARALDLLTDDQRPSYVIFLTDGLPTVGETSEGAIAKHAAERNRVRARLFCFGVGYDVNSRLLDRLARDNFGQSEYVRPQEDLEAPVSRLYRRIGAPVMTDVRLTVDVEGADAASGQVVTRVYPSGVWDLFAGDQAVVFGRYRIGGAARIRLAGTLHGQSTELAFPAELAERSPDDANAFVAKLWATRRVGEILDQIDLQGRNEELVQELIGLGKRHGILTPYTSFLADDTTNLQDRRGLETRAGAAVTDLDAAAGDYAFRQRELKGSYQRAAAAPLAAGIPAAAGPGAPGGAGGGSDRFALGGEELRRLQQAGGRGAVWYDARTDQQRVADTVFSLGGKTFFRRGAQWVDASVAESPERTAAAQQVRRYSPEYFALIDRHGKRIGQFLAIEEPVVLEFDEQVYAIVDP